MKSLYERMQSMIAQMQKLSDEIADKERLRAIKEIKKKMSAFGITTKNLLGVKEVTVPSKVKKSMAQVEITGVYKDAAYKKKLNEDRDFNGASFTKRTKEMCDRMSIIKKGRGITQEHKDAIKKGMLKSGSSMQPVRIDGVLYSNITRASLALGLSKTTVRDRCKNPHMQFKDWVLVDRAVFKLNYA